MAAKKNTMFGKAKPTPKTDVREDLAAFAEEDEELLQGQGIVVQDAQGRLGDEAKFNRSMQKVLADRVLVMFPNTSEPDGTYPIKCGLQGVQFRIARDMEVAIPRAVLAMLIDRKIGVIKQTLNSKREGFDEVTTHSMRFPYQVIQDPAPGVAA